MQKACCGRPVGLRGVASRCARGAAWGLCECRGRGEPRRRLECGGRFGRVGLVRSLARSFVRSFVRSIVTGPRVPRETPRRSPARSRRLTCNLLFHPICSCPFPSSLVLPYFLRFPFTPVTRASFLLSSSASSLPFLPPPHPFVVPSVGLFSQPSPHCLSPFVIAFVPVSHSFLRPSCLLTSFFVRSFLTSFLSSSFVPPFVAPFSSSALRFLPPSTLSLLPSFLPAVLPSVRPSPRLSFFLRVARPPTTHPPANEPRWNQSFGFSLSPLVF